MIIAQDHLGRIATLERLYADRSDDPSFETVRASLGAECELADLVEADGRLRLRLRLPVTLERYAAAIPDLADRADVLDAAIDMALRGEVLDGASEQEAVARLIDRYPAFQTPVREAAALGDALWSTTRLRHDLIGRADDRTLPAGFGPRLEDGRLRYELQEVLGEGAFGRVYLAVDHQLSDATHPALVSIKVLAARPHDDHERRRFVEEATKARRIEHLNVVRVLDRGVSDDDDAFIVYELVSGGDLGRWRRRRPRVSPEEAARLTAGIARGVHAAHMAGLVHCDLKPGNVMLTEAGVPKIADFGIAIRTTGADGVETPGTPLGNLAFISPEQYRREPGALTVPSDLYAIGGILFWLLTGVLPNGATVEQIEDAHSRGTSRPPASPRAWCRDVDGDLDAICRRALSPSPLDRHGSALQLAEDLDTWRRREPIPWRRTPPGRRIGLWIRRQPALAAALALVLVLAVAGGVAGARSIVAHAKLEAEEQALRASEVHVTNAIARVRQEVDDGFLTEVFPAMWFVEYVVGPTLMSDRVDWNELWALRMDTARRLVERHRAAGGETDLQALLWESILGFWLVHDGEHAEATTLLEANERRWRTMLAPADPWLRQLGAMRACALVDRHVDPLAPPVPASELAAAREVLRRVEAELAETHPESPLLDVMQRARSRLE